MKVTVIPSVIGALDTVTKGLVQEPEKNNKIVKESEKRDKYLDFARELKKLWNMKVTEIALVFGPPCTVTKKLVEELEDLEKRRRMKTTQTTALLRSVRILRRVLET